MHRIRSWARQHASERTSRDHGIAPTLPTANDTPFHTQNAQRAPPKSSTHTKRRNGDTVGLDGNVDDAFATDTSNTLPPPAQPPQKSEDARTHDSTIEAAPKPKLTTRMKNGSKRFGMHTKDALLHSWVNVLLIFVPLGIAVAAAGLNPALVFALNAVAIIPLAGLLSHATESVAIRLGDTLGALLNVSFGNAVELIIFIIALVKNEIRIVQASLLGSILANLLLILGMAFLCGGLRYQEQIYNSTVTQMSACLLSLSVTSLLLPTAFHASFSDSNDADDKTLKISRGTSVVLLIVYILYLLFQLKSHAYLYESTPQHIIDEESHPGILAEMLDSSTSSDSSDSSSSSDTDTSGSRTTTKRIKRAFRNRRRRKSSASSVNTASIISALSSPSTERPGSFTDAPTTQPSGPPRRLSALGAIASGDEADTDGELEQRMGAPRVRDFVEKVKEEAAKRDERKHKKKQKKKHHRRHRSRNEKEEDAIAEDSPESHKEGKQPAQPDQHNVAFADEVHTGETKRESSPKKTFGIKQLPSKQAFRPSLPKMLSHNVFVSPPPPPPSGSPIIGLQTTTRPSANRVVSTGIRRTNSLPDRLNRQGTPVQVRPEGIRPYQHQRPTRVASGLDDDEEVEDIPMSRTAAAVLLLISTGLVAVCAEFLVDAIPEMIASTPVSQAFIGLIILPIVANAAEHVTAVTVATKNKMDLAIGVSVGSSIQIALFVTPLVVILGWIMGRDMTLYFNLFETISLFVTAFVVNFLVLDGRSNYLEGSLLIAAYIIIALAAYFYPDGTNASTLGGGS